MPGWMPGAGFKRTARLWHKTLMDVVDKPYRYVKDQMARNSNHPSLVSRLLEQQSRNAAVTPEDEFTIKWVSASLYAGGADTTVSTFSHDRIP